VALLLPLFVAFYVVKGIGDIIDHTLSGPKRAYLGIKDEFNFLFSGIPVGYEVDQKNINYGNEGLSNLFSHQRIILATTGIKLSPHSIFQVLTDKMDSDTHILRFGYNKNKYSAKVYKSSVSEVKRRRFIIKDKVIPSDYERLSLYLGLGNEVLESLDLNADEKSFLLAWETLKSSEVITSESLLDIISTNDRICVFYANNGEFFMSSFSKGNSSLIETINYSDIMDMGFKITLLNQEDEDVQKLVSKIQNDNYSSQVFFNNAIILKTDTFNLAIVSYSTKPTSKYYSKKMESKLFFGQDN